MKLTGFYNADASTDWFTERYQELTVHESLSQKAFRIIEKESLLKDCADVELPVQLANMSWGKDYPIPREGFVNTFIVRQMYDLKEDEYESNTLAKIITGWMQEHLSGTRYLVSLNPAHYLVASADNIDFDDVFVVTRAWSIDCWVGVFDETGSATFVFDAEFWATIISCHPSVVTNDMRAFTKVFNEEFNEIFIRDNHLLSGADPLRAQEYFDKVFVPSV